MRRWLVLAVFAAVGYAGTISGGIAQGQTPHRGVSNLCPQAAQNAYSVKALIQCTSPILGLSTSKNLYIAHRESRYNPFVCNSSDHCGVYQDAQAIWNYEVSHYVYGHTLGALSRTNGRANVILNLRYMKHHGYAPWGM